MILGKCVIALIEEARGFVLLTADCETALLSLLIVMSRGRELGSSFALSIFYSCAQSLFI